MEIQNTSRAYDFIEVAASSAEGDPGQEAYTWNPFPPKELLDGAYDTANDYADAYMEDAMLGGNDGETFELATAILGEDAVDRVVAQSASNKEVLDRLVALELMIIDAIRGEAPTEFQRPKIAFASTNEDVNAYFMPGDEAYPTKPDHPGIIVLSHDLKTWDAEARAEVVLEELGEALASHLETDMGQLLGVGDVGYRLMKVFTGQPLLPEDFIAKPSDTYRIYIGEGKGAHNTVEVPTSAKTPEELAADWGVGVTRVEESLNIALGTQRGPPWTIDSYPNIADWDRVVADFGTNGQMVINEMAHAIAIDAVEVLSPVLPDESGKTRAVTGVLPENLLSATPADTEPPEEDVAGPKTDAELAADWGIADPYDVTNGRQIAAQIYNRLGFAGDEGFKGADTGAVGWDQMIKIYGHDAVGESGPVLQVDELARAIADGTFITTRNSAGETVFDSVNLMGASDTALTDAIWAHAERNSQDGTGRVQITLDLLQDAVAYVTGDPEGFVTDADRQIIQTHYADVFFGDETLENGEPGASRFSKDAIHSIWDTTGFIRRAAVEPDILEFSVSTEHAQAVTPAEVDLGVLGSGYSSYGVPKDAVVSDIEFLSADDNPLGHDVNMVYYTRTSEPDIEYTAAIDVYSPDYHVLAGTRTDLANDEITTYDSVGEDVSSHSYSDIESVFVSVSGRHGVEVMHDIHDSVSSEGHEILDNEASPDVSFVHYQDVDDGKQYIRYQYIGDSGATEPMKTVSVDTDEAMYVSEAWYSSYQAALKFEGNTDGRRLQIDDQYLTNVAYAYPDGNYDPNSQDDGEAMLALLVVGYNAGKYLFEHDIVKSTARNIKSIGAQAYKYIAPTPLAEAASYNDATAFVMTNKGDVFGINEEAPAIATTRKDRVGGAPDDPTPPPVEAGKTHYVEMTGTLQERFRLLAELIQEAGVKLDEINGDISRSFTDPLDGEFPTPGSDDFEAAVGDINAGVDELQSYVDRLENFDVAGMKDGLDKWYDDNRAAGNVQYPHQDAINDLYALIETLPDSGGAIRQFIQNITAEIQLQADGGAMFRRPFDFWTVNNEVNLGVIDGLRNAAAHVFENPDVFALEPGDDDDEDS